MPLEIARRFHVEQFDLRDVDARRHFQHRVAVHRDAVRLFSYTNSPQPLEDVAPVAVDVLASASPEQRHPMQARVHPQNLPRVARHADEAAVAHHRGTEPFRLP